MLEKLISNVDPHFPLVDTPGWCPPELGSLLNQLVTQMPEDQCYLEIGTFCGKSICAAMTGNTKKAFVIDPMDLITGKGSIDDLWHKATYPYGNRITLHKVKAEDFIEALPPIGVFFYDGNHDSGHTFEGLAKFSKYLAKDAVVIVDDYHIFGGAGQKPFPGHDMEFSRPVKKDVDRWCQIHNITPIITPWLNGQAIFQW